MKKTSTTLLSLLLAIGLTTARAQAQATQPASDTQTGPVISSSFFGMTIPADGSDWPSVTIGALGHSPTFAWGWIERSKDVYTWTAFDSYVNAALSHNVDVVITFGRTPGWAVANQSSCSNTFGVSLCTAPPDNIQDWKSFITQAATHFKGRVKYYELWNEANSRTFWSGTVADMVAMAAAAYPIIKSIDPDAVVLTPSVTGPVGTSLTNDAATWMTQYLQAGGNLYADGGTFHGYLGRTGVRPYPMPEQDWAPGCVTEGDCQKSIITKATAFRLLFDGNGLAGKPMFDTEGSWGNNNITDPEQQSAFLARWYLLQASNKVDRAYWYSWGACNGDSTNAWGCIENADGTSTEAGRAYGEVYKWLVGATMSTPCSAAADSTWTCGLTRGGGYEAQAVWNTSVITSYVPPPQFTQYRDLAGNTFTITPGSLVAIGAKPILLEAVDPVMNPAPELTAVEILRKDKTVDHLVVGSKARKYQVVLTGSGFKTDSKAVIGGTDADTTLVTTTQLTATLPFKFVPEAGGLTVQVRNADGQLSKTMTIEIRLQ